jgi:outer membrane murein-binding lipoprotein Lpp
MRIEMKNAIVAVIAGVVVAVIVSGCQQQKTQVPNEKQARLLAAQSADLQKELAACRAEIEALREKHARELQERDEELARCKARIEALQKDLEAGIAERVAGVTTKLMHENARLRQEVEQLKTQIASSPEGNVP